MILNCLVVLSCIAICFGSGYHKYYLPEQPEPVIDQYSDGDNYGHQGTLDYDHGSHRQLQKTHGSHGARDYGSGENHAVKDFAKQEHHNQGAHAAVHSTGGEQNHVKKSHDKGFYEREKKYGYEKAYGYERETKHHDKDSKAVSHGSGYNHHENKGHYNHGAQAVRDLAAHGNKHKHGSESHGNSDVLLDISGDHNTGKDAVFHYNNAHKLRNLRLRRPGPLRKYMPMFMKKDYINDIDGSLARFRHLSGIHGLGGLRGYGFGYGYKPMGYGINHLDINDDHELTYLDHEPLEDIEEPTSNVYYIKHEA